MFSLKEAQEKCDVLLSKGNESLWNEGIDV